MKNELKVLTATAEPRPVIYEGDDAFNVCGDSYYTELAKQSLGLDEPEDYEPTERDYRYLDA